MYRRFLSRAVVIMFFVSGGMVLSANPSLACEDPDLGSIAGTLYESADTVYEMTVQAKTTSTGCLPSNVNVPPVNIPPTSCGSGEIFTVSTTATASWRDHRHAVTATTYWVSARTIAGSPVYLTVRDSACGAVCTSWSDTTQSCAATFRTTGLANIEVQSRSGWSTYELQVVPLVSRTECTDDIDNDANGGTDYAADGGCSTAYDNDESPGGSSCTDVGVTLCASYTTGPVSETFTVYTPATTSVPAAGHIDLYEFVLPNGGRVAVPCLVVVSGATTNPCATAGATFVSRSATLVSTSVPLPTSSLSQPLATVHVCSADLVLTVNGIGITSFPGYTVC